MPDTQAPNSATSSGNPKTPRVWAERLSIHLGGVATLLFIIVGLLTRSEAPTWRSLSGIEQSIIILMTVGAVFHVGRVVIWVRDNHIRDVKPVQRARLHTVIVVLMAFIVVLLAGLQWTTWPFDIAFWHEREQAKEFAQSGQPYDGMLVIGHILHKASFQTDAGPLFRTTIAPHDEAGYLYRPESPPPPETWTTVGSVEGSCRRCIRFREVYPLSDCWYAVVWEWGERKALDDGS